MDELGQNVLACARLASQHHGYGGGGQAEGLAVNVVHLLVGDDDLFPDFRVHQKVAQMVFQGQDAHAGLRYLFPQTHKLAVIGNGVDDVVDFLIFVKNGNGGGEDVVLGPVAHDFRLGLSGFQDNVDDVAGRGQHHVLPAGDFPHIAAKVILDVKLGQLAVVPVAPDNGAASGCNDDSYLQGVVDAGHIPHPDMRRPILHSDFLPIVDFFQAISNLRQILKKVNRRGRIFKIDK